MCVTEKSYSFVDGRGEMLRWGPITDGQKQRAARVLRATTWRGSSYLQNTCAQLVPLTRAGRRLPPEHACELMYGK